MSPQCSHCGTVMAPRPVGVSWDGGDHVRPDPTVVWVCPCEADGYRHDTLRTGGRGPAYVMCTHHPDRPAAMLTSPAVGLCIDCVADDLGP